VYPQEKNLNLAKKWDKLYKILKLMGQETDKNKKEIKQKSKILKLQLNLNTTISQCLVHSLKTFLFSFSVEPFFSFSSLYFLNHYCHFDILRHYFYGNFSCLRSFGKRGEGL
jgi:hypothetical protein